MHTDNTEPEVSVGLHGTIKESSESESESKYSRSYERSLIEKRSVNIEAILMFRVDAAINAWGMYSAGARSGGLEEYYCQPPPPMSRRHKLAESGGGITRGAPGEIPPECSDDTRWSGGS